MPSADDYVKQFAPPIPDTGAPGGTAAPAGTTATPSAPPQPRGLVGARLTRDVGGEIVNQLLPGAQSAVTDIPRYLYEVATDQAPPAGALSGPGPVPAPMPAPGTGLSWRRIMEEGGRGAGGGAVIGGAFGIPAGPLGMAVGAGGGAVSGFLGGAGAEAVHELYPSGDAYYVPEITGALLGGTQGIVRGAARAGLNLITHGVSGLVHTVMHGAANNVAHSILNPLRTTRGVLSGFEAGYQVDQPPNQLAPSQ